LFTAVSAALDLQLMFKRSAVRVLMQQQVWNFVFADLEQNGGQGVLVLSARVSDGMSLYTLVFFGYFSSYWICANSVSEIGTVSFVKRSGCS
jgi:hypothetical protein